MENDDSEKDSAFRGLCMVVSLNPEVCMTDFKLFVDAILSWYAPKEDLARMFASLLASFKSQLGEQRWNEMLGFVFWCIYITPWWV
jgi:transportin-2